MDKKLGFNVIFNIGYNILTAIVPFITAPYLGRVLGAHGVGIYTYAQTVASYFVMVGTLGLSNYGNRSIAAVRDDREKRTQTFRDIYGMQLVTGCLATASYVIYATFICRQDKLVTYIVSFYVMTCFLTIDWFYQGMEEFKVIAIRSFVVKLFNLVGIFALVHTSDDVPMYALVMSLGYLISPILLWTRIRKDVDTIKPSFAHIWEHLKPNYLLFIPAISATIYQTMDKIMIGAISSKAELAYYEYADKIISIPNLIFTSFGTVMLSRMSNLVHKDDSTTKQIIGYSMDISFAISTSCAFGIAAIAIELVQVYYGSNFLETGPILMVLTPVVIMYGWSNVLRMQYIIPNKLDFVYIKSTITASIVNLILNAIFIPRNKAIGATVGTLTAQFIVAAIFSHYAHKELPLGHYIKRNIPLFIVGLLMFGAIKLVQTFHGVSVIGLIADILIGSFIYVALYILWGALEPNKKTATAILIRKILKR